VSCRRTLAVAIVATTSLGENLRFAIRTALGFPRRRAWHGWPWGTGKHFG